MPYADPDKQREYQRLYARRLRATQPEKVKANKARFKRRSASHVNTIKASTPCHDCGVQYPPHVMTFDHVRGTKETDIAVAAWRWSVERIDEEIAKCEIVCANCHAERTYQRKVRGDKPRGFSGPRHICPQCGGHKARQSKRCWDCWTGEHAGSS